jgi:hypothetical protein
MEDFNKVELVEPASLLTEREKWLMEQAFTAARYDNMRTFDEWLKRLVAEGETIEMILVKDAPIPAAP